MLGLFKDFFVELFDKKFQKITKKIQKRQYLRDSAAADWDMLFGG